MQHALPDERLARLYRDDDWAAFARRLFVEDADGVPTLAYDPNIAGSVNRAPAESAPADPWDSFDMLADVFVLAVMYAAAAFGWLVYMALPPVIASVLQAVAQRRLGVLRSAQRKLVEEWGEDLIRDALPDRDA